MCGKWRGVPRNQPLPGSTGFGDHCALPCPALVSQFVGNFWSPMATIPQALREDHDKQRTLASLLTKAHGDSHGREELSARLKNDLVSHVGA